MRHPKGLALSIYNSSKHNYKTSFSIHNTTLSNANIALSIVIITKLKLIILTNNYININRLQNTTFINCISNAIV